MLNVLLVDDSRSARHLIAQYLESVAQCAQAENGKMAVEVFEKAVYRKSYYDLVIMDIMMPVMDGHKAVEKILALQEQYGVSDEHRSRIVMLSSLDDSRNIMKAQFDNGADLYLTKPVNERNLMEALANLGLIGNPLDDNECSTF